MELLYVWIEDHNCIKNQGFNFNPRYEFSFEPIYNVQAIISGNLAKKDLEPTTEDNFFGEHISNITAIVGKNGTGKSSLINTLFSLNDLYFYKRNLFIFKEGDDILVYARFFNEKTISFNFNAEIQQYDISFNEYKKITFVYLNHSLITNDVLRKNRVWNKSINISTSQFLKSGIEQYNSHEVALNLKVLYQENLGNLKISIPGILNIRFHITIQPNEPPRSFDDGFKKTIGNFFVEKFSNLKKEYENRKENNTINDYNKKIFFDYFMLVVIFNYLRTAHDYMLIDIWNKFNDIVKSNTNDFIFLLKRITEETDNILKNYQKNISKYQDEFNAIENTEKSILRIEKIILLSIRIEELYNFVVLNNIELDMRMLDITDAMFEGIDTKQFDMEFIFNLSNNKKLIEQLHYVISDTELDIFPYDYVQLSWWQFSSGEQIMLNTYSRLHHIKNKIIDDNIILLIDEGELYLHPEWQKRYINDLIDILKNVFPNKKTQIILTSHSPFIISDLPKENVIFLDKDNNGNCEVVPGIKKQQTFGANIHTLFAEAFFLENGLIGDFAKDKINAVIKELKADKPTQAQIEHAEKIIDLIGEPVLRIKLTQLLNDVKNKRD